MTDHTTDGSDRQTNPGYLHRRSDDFGKVPAELMHDLTLTDGAVRLYAHMHWRYGSNCTNFEGRASMAKYLGVSEATISHRVAELVAADWIVVVPQTNKKGRATNFYHVFEVKAECRKWRKLHPEAQEKPEPKQPKDGEEPGRKLRRGIGGRPLHKPKDETPGNETQVKNTTGQLVNLGSQTNVNSSSHDPEALHPEKTGIDTSVSIPRTVANAPDAPAVPTPEEDAIDALRAELSATLTEEEKPPPPVPPPAAPFAHVAPAGHVWIASADSIEGMTVHLGRNTSDKSRPVCGARMKHRTTHIQLGAQPCAACVAKATAPQKPKKRQPPPDVKTYIAELCYGKGDGLIGASWSSIVNAWNEIGFPDLDKLEHFKRYWYLEYWLGKEKNKRPEPHQIVKQWDASIAWGGGLSEQEEAAKEAAIMAELAEMAKYGKPRAVKNHE